MADRELIEGLSTIISAGRFDGSTDDELAAQCLEFVGRWLTLPDLADRLLQIHVEYWRGQPSTPTDQAAAKVAPLEGIRVLLRYLRTKMER